MKRLLPALLAGAALLLAGCGTAAPDRSPDLGIATGQPDAAASVSSTFNDHDVMFAQMLVAHHAETGKIVPLAAKRAQRAEIRTLASAIDVTQADEVQTLQRWLLVWGRPVAPAADPSA